jgi:hypothetical protein
VADIIKRPAIGPTKSNTDAADRLDAAVSNPDYLCVTGRIEHVFSSKLYPVDAFDVMLVNATIGDDCVMTAIPFFELTATFGAGPSGTLEQLRWFYYDGPYGPDELAPTFGPGLVFTLEEITVIVEGDSPDEPLLLSLTINSNCTMDAV